MNNASDLSRTVGIAGAGRVARAGALAVLCWLASGSVAGAESGSSPDGASHPKSSYYRSGGSGAQVRGYTARRGGYSYSVPDTINTYGDSRSVYGANQSFRDRALGNQTTSGPFDHGFFFDSGIRARGGDSPYLN